MAWREMSGEMEPRRVRAEWLTHEKPDGDESRIVGGDAGMSELKPWPFCGGSNVRHIEEIPGYLDKKPKYRHCPRCSAKVVNR